MLEPLEPRRHVGLFASLRRVDTSRLTRNGMKGQESREALLATGEGKPLKAEAQGRYSHETGRGRIQAE
jgi:hypothetical protein